MTRKQCGNCRCLGTMQTMNGIVDCCKWFHTPRDLSKVDCKEERYGFGTMVYPRIKGQQFNPHL